MKGARELSFRGPIRNPSCAGRVWRSGLADGRSMCFDLTNRSNCPTHSGASGSYDRFGGCMGQQARCTVRFNGRARPGKALLESEALIFRGDEPAKRTEKRFRLMIPFRAMKSVKASRGSLLVEFPEGAASLGLGPQAETWA